MPLFPPSATGEGSAATLRRGETTGPLLASGSLRLVGPAPEISALPRAPAPIVRRLFEAMRILCVDIGGTRTKFMYQHGSTKRLLPPAESKVLWQDPGKAPELRGKLAAVLTDLPLPPSELDVVVFSVPGTVELGEGGRDQMSVVRNMPSLSPQFRGFDFKSVFTPLFPRARVYAVADNLAAAMGAACMPRFRGSGGGLVLVLGTAPAVSTYFRPLKGGVSEGGKVSKNVELAIWQSWVWFTKIPLTVDKLHSKRVEKM